MIHELRGEVRRLASTIANTPRLGRKDLAIRYSKDLRTIDRWKRRKLLPEAIRFTGPLWRLADLEAAERAGALPRPVST